MSTITSHSPLNISETVRDRGLVPKEHQLKVNAEVRRWRWVYSSRVRNSKVCFQFSTERWLRTGVTNATR